MGFEGLGVLEEGVGEGFLGSFVVEGKSGDDSLSREKEEKGSKSTLERRLRS